MKYVTLVSEKEIVLSKSHHVRWIGLTIYAACGRTFEKDDTTVRVTELPECRGVCKACERRKAG